MHRKKSRPFGMLPFEISGEPLPEAMTGRAGLVLIVEMFRALGLDRVVGTEVRVKERERGFSETEMVEEFVLMLAAGGDCLEDFELLAGDEGLEKGRETPTGRSRSPSSPGARRAVSAACRAIPCGRGAPHSADGFPRGSGLVE
jgi:hypothetical protein